VGAGGRSRNVRGRHPRSRSMPDPNAHDGPHDMEHDHQFEEMYQLGSPRPHESDVGVPARTRRRQLAPTAPNGPYGGQRWPPAQSSSGYPQVSRGGVGMQQRGGTTTAPYRQAPVTRSRAQQGYPPPQVRGGQGASRLGSNSYM